MRHSKFGPHLTLAAFVIAMAMPALSADLQAVQTPSAPASLPNLQAIDKLPVTGAGFARKPKKTSKPASSTPATDTPPAVAQPTATQPGIAPPVVQPPSTETPVSIKPSDLRYPLELIHPIIKTYHAVTLDVASHACRALDMADMDLSTQKCADLDQAFHSMSLQWSDLLEQFNVLGGGPALEALANDWRAYVGLMRVKYGDNPFAAPTVP